eukprot:12099584-Karenia_brevis.AAC.1
MSIRRVRPRIPQFAIVQWNIRRRGRPGLVLLLSLLDGRDWDFIALSELALPTDVGWQGSATGDLARELHGH